MPLTKKQEEALKVCVSGFLNGDKYKCIAGYAGISDNIYIYFSKKNCNIKYIRS